MYISLWENSRGHPDNVSFMQFSTKIDGFEQKDSQGFFLVLVNWNGFPSIFQKVQYFHSRHYENNLTSP